MKNYIVTFDFHDDSLRDDFKSELQNLGLEIMDDNQTTFFGYPNRGATYILDENAMEVNLRRIYNRLMVGRAHKRDKVSFYFPSISNQTPEIIHKVVVNKEP